MYDKKEADFLKTAEDMKENLETMMEDEINKLKERVKRKVFDNV